VNGSWIRAKIFVMAHTSMALTKDAALTLRRLKRLIIKRNKNTGLPPKIHPLFDSVEDRDGLASLASLPLGKFGLTHFHSGGRGYVVGPFENNNRTLFGYILESNIDDAESSGDPEHIETLRRTVSRAMTPSEKSYSSLSARRAAG
jgi:hypothetical protein